MNIGIQIARLRKEKGITQKELAEAIGVSAAAVSKWENAGANPDVELLAPLARYFGTTTDVLLDAAAQPDEAQVNQIAENIRRKFRDEGHRAGMDACNKIICTYPDHFYLRLKLAGMVTAHMMFLKEEECTEENHLEFLRFGLKAIEPVLCQRDSRYWTQANTIAASYEMMLGNYEQAEQHLKEMKPVEVDVNTLYPALYLYQEKWTQARQCAMKNVAGYGRMVMQFLGTAMAALKKEGCWDELSETARRYNALEKTMGYMDGMGHHYLLEVCLEQGKQAEAEQELLSLAQSLRSFLLLAVRGENHEWLNEKMTIPAEIYQRLLENNIFLLEHEPQYEKLRDSSGYQQALALLNKTKEELGEAQV